jgi:hypothetical protein
MVVLMLVEVVAEFKTMRQYLAMRKLGRVPDSLETRGSFLKLTISRDVWEVLLKCLKVTESQVRSAVDSLSHRLGNILGFKPHLRIFLAR